MASLFRIASILGLGVMLPGLATAQTVRSVRIASGLQLPVAVGVAPGDYSRLFVAEQSSGRIELFINGVAQATPFLNIQSKITTSGGEQGLLGFAFHPNYANNGYFYVSYSTPSGTSTVVERYQAQPPNANTVNTNTATLIITHLQPQTNHNGGCLAFGPDGKLYISRGDGGGANDTGTGHAAGGNGQSPATLLGKILRLDVDIPPPYIPSDNPFVGNPVVRDEIWHLGLRNPWRFSFDRSTGAMYIGDVGQNAIEEIDYQAPGVSALNFGWRCMEGPQCTGLTGCTCNAPTLTLPIHSYNHTFGVAVTGGYVYRGCAIPGLQGHYFFADYSSARIWSFLYSGGSVSIFTERTAQLAPGGGLSITSISSFGEDAYGEILICDRGGEIFKILPSSFVSDCNANNIEDSCEIAAGQAPDINGNGIIDTCECTAPVVYCSPKTTSNGCVPLINSSGTPSATSGSGFVVGSSSVINNKPGLLLYGSSGQSSTPFQGGILCVAPPIKRSIGVNSGGNPPPDDCSGAFTIDMNAFAVGALGGNPLPALLVVGTVIDAQWWGRDSGFPPPDNTQLSNGLQYQVCP